MGKKIGYPEYIESDELLNAEFDGLEILEDHFLNNILRMKKYEVWKELSKLSRPVDKNNRSDDMIERVEKIVLEDRRMNVGRMASKLGISARSVSKILHEDLKMPIVSSRGMPRMLTDDHKAAHVACFQAMLMRDNGMNGILFSSIVTMDETWMLFFSIVKRSANQLNGNTDTDIIRHFK
ncbi:hypothetical protein FHG87_008029 [Trinorchestia longiramus]|nr:hypothetical protein FHG87_008029 [Trinorchestia longiramus]